VSISIQNPRAWGRLVDAFSLTGRHLLRLDEIVVPVVVVENLAPSDEVLSDADATYTIIVAADALGPGRAILLNDAGSGVRFLIDKITISAAGTMNQVVTLSTTAPTTGIAGGSADKTWNNNAQAGEPPGTMFADRGVFVGPDVYSAVRLANTPSIVEPKLVLDPGQEVVVQSPTTNLLLRVVINARIVASG